MVRTNAGINEDGMFGVTRAGWRPDLPDACHERFIPLLWLKVHELLGRVPEGSTARFIQDGTLPGEARGRRQRLRDGVVRAHPGIAQVSGFYAAAASCPAAIS